MIDYHIHIGQFNEIYYNSSKIFSIIERLSSKTKINKFYYSSTSSCRDDAELIKIEEEINYAQNLILNGIKAYPYLWFIPKYAEQRINVASAAKSFDYCGIKLHPAGQIWDENNSTHLKSLHQIFRWANDNKKIILIHCGKQSRTLPSRFELFFSEYKDAKIILAHSNPIQETIEMINKYENVFSDTAFVTQSKLETLYSKINDKTKILFGSDFPITHYYSTHLFLEKKTLKQEYLDNCNLIKCMQE